MTIAAEDGLSAFRFDSLQDEPRLMHAIFERRGGCSPSPFNSLNVGSEVGDDPVHVKQNYVRLCDYLGICHDDLVTARQVHSGRVAVVGERDRGRVVGELDGLVTAEPGLPLILRFADCVPILIYDPVGPVLGLAHAGWRGTLSKIAQEVVRTMSVEFGSRPSDLIVGIGPSIGPCCYEVGPDVIEAVMDTFGGGECLFTQSPAGRKRLDLWLANRLQLEESGVRRIETAQLCTACHRERFFSHRADGGTTGRFPAVAMLREEIRIHDN